MTEKTAGYSGTPLAKKLGIGAGARVLTLGAPGEYESLLGSVGDKSASPLPPGVVFAPELDASIDVIHVFVDRRAALEAHLRAFRTAMRADAIVWVSWPKKASKVPTDITEDTIREIALPLGLVDVKVAAVSEVWSGLKLCIRKELRGK